MVKLPQGVLHLIDSLEAAGFEAWAVGGCVRDSLLNLVPHDWDVCTSAKPEEVLSVFHDLRVIKTGILHGTVTVMQDNIPYEVTTFRTESKYSDSRRPDSVDFVTNLKDDLSRRDFTVNAMAFHPVRGLYDIFGGAEDLKKKLIKCVLNPKERFEEDALRIMRALRFASTYGFAVESATAAALLDARERLLMIAPERIREELMRLLSGVCAADILRDYDDVLFVIMPELAPMRGLKQYNPSHHLNVWEHTLAAISAIAPDPVLRLAVLLHDAGKPARFFRDQKGVGHFYGHPEESLKIAKCIMDRLRYDNRTRKTVEELVLFHDDAIPAREKNVCRWLSRVGEERIRQLISIKRADAMAQHPAKREAKLQHLTELLRCLNEVLEKRLPYRLKDLAITGDDLKAAGIKPGPELGRLMQSVLKRVIDGTLQNSKDALLNAALKSYNHIKKTIV